MDNATSIVTYAKFDESDKTSADYKRQLDKFVFEHLPLDEVQREEFLSILRAEQRPAGFQTVQEMMTRAEAKENDTN
jgi:hypothetical protein